MKKLIALGLLVSMSAWSTTYAPNDGTARQGNPGTAHMDPTILQSTDPTIENQETLERSNTTPNPIPDDTTLQGTGAPEKQAEEAEETDEQVDPSTSPRVDHTDMKGEEIP